MKPRLITLAKWLGYPLFYVTCLGVFAYVSFPYERIKDRLIAEFDREQAAQGSDQKLSIDELTSYWFSGAELSGVKLTLPPEPGDEKAKPVVIEIERAHARVRLLPLLLGRVRVDFWASTFGGEISGSLPVAGDSSGKITLALDGVDLAKATLLRERLGVPLKGVLSGTIELETAEGKLAGASGAIDLKIAALSVGDGETKIMDQLPIPEARVGDLSLVADVKGGLVQVTKLSAPGPDLELVGDGQLTLRDPWKDALADLYLRFKFSDAYRGKTDLTKSLLGEPGSKMPALIDLDPKMKKAKRADGFYGFHAHGSLRHPKFDPSASGAPDLAPSKGKASPFQKRKKGGATDAFPLGTSEAVKADPPSRVARPERASDESREFPMARPEVMSPPAAPPPGDNNGVLIVGARPPATAEPVAEPPPQAPEPPDGPGEGVAEPVSAPELDVQLPAVPAE
jgi:type II secretion system protein N